MAKFVLKTDMKPKGDQPQAIDKLTERILSGKRYSTLLGATGTGKTFTMANVIKNVAKPTLVISHNKTLAAQLYAEFKEFFPDNAVCYFVSYYDFYQPEAYIPQKDLYIEKEVDINEQIEKLRLAATTALVTRDDVIIVASVSCIYNLGSPSDYRQMIAPFKTGEKLDRKWLLRRFVDLQYQRNDVEFKPGIFRVRGDIIDIFPSYEENAVRIQYMDDTIEAIYLIHPVSNQIIKKLKDATIYPAKHFVMPEDKIERALRAISEELEDRVKFFKDQQRLIEAHRLEARTRYDMEMIRETGYCKGIENYSRHFDGRKPGERPNTLIDYFPKDFLVIVDESHVTLPQLHGMFNGDHSRKKTLVEYGFRLPSALDNRPLKFEEWHDLCPQLLFVSATPDSYEIKKCRGEVVEQIIRPTGVVDPAIKVEKASDQIKSLIVHIRKKVENKQRVLVTTVTKRLAEDVSMFLRERGLKAKYLHSEIQTIDRAVILRDLREGKFDVLVGVNLLREGLDLPEVGLVAVLDADKEGFLRSKTSIIQTIGRAARNVNGEVILYADNLTKAIKEAIAETERRRKIQIEYNKKHNITPQTVKKEIRRGIDELAQARKMAYELVGLDDEHADKLELLKMLEDEMFEAARNLNFEKAAKIRDAIKELAGDKGIKKIRLRFDK